MNVFYEEEGSLKAATVLADNDASFQVETPHGKRAKIKAANVLLKFAAPSAAALLEESERLAGEMEEDFLWECCGEGEFGFAELARDYFGHEPSPVEAAAVALKLHGAPVYFYKKGKGRYKAAPEENLKAALAALERKRIEGEKIAAHAEALATFTLPEELAPHVPRLLFKPDKNTLEFKALEKACEAAKLPPYKLLARCGAFAHPRDFHLGRFLFEFFPKGHHFPSLDAPHAPEELPEARVAAFSIDDSATTEIDDAFSVTRLPSGLVRVGIHIAAPALGIPTGAELDALARERLSTVYMPGDKITMLPDMAVQRFTLQEGRTVPAFSLYLDLEPDTFAVTARASRIEAVTVAANLRHETLEPVFNEATLAAGLPDFPFRDELAFLWNFADTLEEQRGRPDAGKTFYPEYAFRVENDRVQIVPRQRGTPIDKLVSELMIGVNSTWAQALADNGIPAVYRAQEAGKVRMTTQPAPHRGLGVSLYMWSSSPLRRYIDLINQRQLAAWLRGEEPPHAASAEDLFAVMRDFDAAYDGYNTFQRQMERFWTLRYLTQEGITSREAEVVKENIVRLSGLPLTLKVHDLPDVAPGTRVRLELGEPDLLDLECPAKYRGTLADPAG